jgi:hypothetical protein
MPGQNTTQSDPKKDPLSIQPQPYFFLRMPQAMKDELKRAAQLHSEQRGRPVPVSRLIRYYLTQALKADTLYRKNK